MFDKLTRTRRRSLLCFCLGVFVGWGGYIASSRIPTENPATRRIASAPAVVAGAAEKTTAQSAKALIEKWRASGQLDASEQTSLLEAIEGWLGTDPAGALEWIGDEGLTNLLGDTFIDGWLKEELQHSPAGLTNTLRAIANPLLRNELQLKAFGILESQSPAEAMQFLKIMPPTLRYGCTTSLAESWARSDPNAAFEAFLTDGPATFMLGTVLGEWARKDPAAAFEAISRRSDTDIASASSWRWTKARLLESLVGSVYGRSPEVALDLLRKMPETAALAEYRIMAMGVELARQPDRLNDLLEMLPDNVAKQRLLALAANSCDPANALKIIPMIEAETVRAGAYKRQARSLAIMKSLPKALEWASSIDDTLGRYAAIRSVAETGVGWKPSAAIEYAASSPGSAYSGVVLDVVCSLLDQPDFKQDGRIFLPPKERDKWRDSLSQKGRDWLISQIRQERPDVVAWLSQAPNR